ncbi:CcmD family protein [Chryseolinea lacunae]|uniref:CcmD family protein n=1 Tax=Chryseolinea lacunae TaxID=2801331 RepID=A0ABS1KMT2_9BACT|nr:CcmD family protein [Chryseolinea lacunae]MBL0740770.1 CcmD family protein [Chryseolinea lacunae]
MKWTRLLLLFGILCLSAQGHAQTSGTPEMADALRSDGKIYTVVVGLVIILTGVIFYLIRIDRKVQRIEKNQKKQ